MGSCALQMSRFRTERTTQDICNELAARAMKKMADEDDSREAKRNREEDAYDKLMAQKREMRARPPLVLKNMQDSTSTRRVQFHEGDDRGNSPVQEREVCVADVDERPKNRAEQIEVERRAIQWEAAEVEWEREELRRDRESERYRSFEGIRVREREEHRLMEEERTRRDRENRGERPDGDVALVAAKGSWCPACFISVEGPNLKRHRDAVHLPWWLNPMAACWTCRLYERSSAFLRARHAQCQGAWNSDARLIEWARLANGLLRHFAQLLECPDKESFLAYIHDMGIGAHAYNSQEGSTVAHKQRMLVQAFSIFSGDRVSHCSWSPPQRFSAVVGRPVIRQLVDRLSTEEIRVVSRWEKLSPEVEPPRCLELIDSHCHVDGLLERGVPLSSLFQDASVKLEYILASRNFPNSWDTHRVLMTEARIFLTIGLHPHVTSQPVSEGIWREQQQLWRLKKCCGVGEIGLDYTHPVGHRLHQTQQLHQILQEAPTHLPIILHCREESLWSKEAENDMRGILRQHVPRNRVVCIHSFSGDVFSAEAWKRCFPQAYFGIGKPSMHHLSAELMEVITYDRFMLESDAPYQQKTALDVCIILKKMSGIVNLPPRVLAEASRLNTCRCFGLPATL